MRKRIGILLVLMFASLGLFACGKDPYAKMSMSLSKSEVNLTLVEDNDTNQIVGTPESVTVEVEAPKNVSAEIVLPEYGEGYGDEYVSIEIESEEAGKYVLKLTAKKQGKTEIQIKTAEGNITKVISVNIDVAVNAISFKDDALAAIEIGSTYDFNTYGKSLINYTPSYTSQTDVDFYIADDILEYLPSGVSLVDNVLKINKGVRITDFPEFTDGDETYNYILLSARSKHNNDVATSNTFKIRVINPLDLTSDYVGARMYYSDQADNLKYIDVAKKLSTESRLEYELTFASHYAGSGEVDDIYSKHSLIFGGTLDLYINNTKDYKIVYDKVDTDIVNIFDSITPDIPDEPTNYHLYNDIQSDEVGTYVANFRVEYTGGTDNGQFDGMFTKYISVTINVITLPTNTNISINDQEYKNGNNILAVYDYYQKSNGTQLTITSEACTNLQYSIESITDVEIGDAGLSVKDSRNQNITDISTKFNNGEVIYLKNNTGETSTVVLKLTLYCNVYNESYLIGATDTAIRDSIIELQTYKKTISIKLNLVSGLENIEFVETEPFVLDVIADADGAIFYTFGEGVIAEGVVLAIDYKETDLFSYTFVDNSIILIPNSNFIEGKDSVRILLTNGVISSNAREVVVQVPYEVDPETNKQLVISKINQKNEGFFAFGSIEATNTSYGSDFSNADSILGYYTNETGKKIFTKESGIYTFDNFDNLIISTYASIELDFYRLLIYNKEIKYTNVNALKIESTNSEKLFWANGKLFSYGGTTYNEASKTHFPITLTIKNGDVALQTINVYICQRIEEVVLSSEIFHLYTEGTLNPLYIEESRELVKIEVTKNGEFKNEADKAVEAGRYGNIYSDYKMIGADDIVFSFVNKNIEVADEEKIVKVLKSYLLELQDDLDISMGGYVKMLKAKLTLPANAKFNGSNDQLLAEIFGKDGVTIEFSGVIKQFNQEFPVGFSVNIKYAIKTNNNIVTTLNDETGIYFEQKSEQEINRTGNNEYTFNYTLFPSNATFKDIFVQMSKVNGDSDDPVKIAVSYKKQSGEFVEYKIYESGNFDPRIYFAVDYAEETPKDVDFLIGIYGGKITIKQVKATAGTYIFTIVTLDNYFIDSIEYRWTDEDPTKIAFEDSVINNQAFSVKKTFNLSIADGSINAPYQIRTTANMIDFLRKNKSDNTAVGKYYVIANDIFFNRQFTADGINSYKYSDYIGELKNHLGGRFTKYYGDGKKEIYNRVVYGFNINLKNVSTDMNVGLFTSIAEGFDLSYVTLGNSTININTISSKDISLNVGSLVGVLNNESQIIGCKVQGNINIEIAKDDNAGIINLGGLVGKATGNGSINSIPDTSINVNNSDINSNVAIRYVGKNANIGGVAGYVDEVEINDIHTIPSIVSLDKNGNYTESNIGGIAGYIKRANVNNVVVYPILVGHSNIGGIAGVMAGGTITNSQVQVLYNINMKNVIAGFYNIGGVIGKISAEESNQKTNIDYVYVRSYTTKAINLYDTTTFAVNKFHTLYTNNYYGAVVLLPTEDANRANYSLGGIIGISEAGDGLKDQLTINHSYFASHAISFNESAKLAGIVGQFKDYVDSKNTLYISNSYVDGTVSAVYKDINGDLVNNFSLNFITSTKETNDDGSTLNSGVETVSYNVKGDLSNETSSYLVVTQTKVVSNVIMTYTDTYPNVVSGEYVYSRLNNSLFGLSSLVEGGRYSYSGYTSNTKRTTIVIANVAKNVSENMLVMFAKLEEFKNTPTGSFYYAYLLKEDGSTISDAQLSYLDNDLAQFLLQNKFYELQGSDKVKPDMLITSALTSGEEFNEESTEEQLFNLLKKFNEFSSIVNTGNAKNDLGEIYKVVINKCTSLMSNSINDSVVNLTRIINANENSVSTQFANGIPYVVASFNIDGKTYEYTAGSEGYELTGTTFTDEAKSLDEEGNSKTSRRFVLLGGRPVKIGVNALDTTKTNNSSEILKLFKVSKTNINPGEYEFDYYGLHNVNGTNYITKIILGEGSLEFNDTDGAYSNTGEWVEDESTPYYVADDKSTIDESDDEYFIFIGEPKLVYIDNTRKSVLAINELTNSIVIDGITYNVVNETLYDSANDKYFSKENVGYSINTKLTVSTESTSLTISKICNLVEATDNYTDELNLSYSSLEDIFTQLGFKNFNGEFYQTNIIYNNSSYISWDETTKAWYYGEDMVDLVTETIIYADEENYIYEKYKNVYFDGNNWYYVDQQSTVIAKEILTALKNVDDTVIHSLIVNAHTDSEGNYWIDSYENEQFKTDVITKGNITYTLNKNGEDYDGTYTMASTDGTPIFISNGEFWFDGIYEYNESNLKSTTFKYSERNIQVTSYFDGTNWYEDDTYNTLVSDTSVLRGAQHTYFDGTSDVTRYFDGTNWYEDSEYSILVDDTSILSGATHTYALQVTRYFDGTDWYEDEMHTILVSDTSSLKGAVAISAESGDAYTDGIYWYSDAIYSSILNNVLFIEKAVDEESNIIGNYEKDFYQLGRWFYDKDHTMPIINNSNNSELLSHLPDNLTKETEYVYNGVKYYFAFEWYKNDSYSEMLNESLMDEIENQVYYYKETTYYKQYNWYLDDEAKKLVTDNAVLLYLSGKVSSEVPYNGATYYYRANWFIDSKFTTLVSDEVILNLLNKVEDYSINEDGSYLLQTWYYDNLYTQPIKETDSTISGHYFDVKLSKFDFEIDGSKYALKIDNGAYTIFEYKSESVELSTLFTELEIESGAAVQSVIVENGKLCFLQDSLSAGQDYLRTIDILNEATGETKTHYVIDEVKLDNEFNFQINGVKYSLIDNEGVYTFVENIEESVELSALFTKLAINSSNAIQSMIVQDGEMYLLLNTLPAEQGYIKTINILNTTTSQMEKHYVVCIVELTSLDAYTWLTTSKVNAGMPVLVSPTIIMSLTFDGSNYNYEINVEYHLIYDELATFTLYAQPFTKAINDDKYVADDAGKEHSAHIKKDDNSVVLMYNKTIEERADVNKYKISFGEKINGYYFAQLNGIVVDLSAIKIDKESAMQLVISSSDIGVAEIVKIANTDEFAVYVNGEGNTTLTFYNLKDDSIKVTLNVTAIKGFTDFEIFNDDSESVSSLETFVGGNPTYYNLGLTNEIGGIEYEANKGGFYVQITSIDGVSDILDLKQDVDYSSVTIGNYLINAESLTKIYEFTNPNISIQANNCNVLEDYGFGIIGVKITPYVICDGEKVSIEDLVIETEIEIKNAARSISFAEKTATIIPDGEKEIAINVYSNKDDESIRLIINGSDLYWDSENVINRDNFKDYLYDGSAIDGSLLNVRLKSVSTVMEMIGSQKMFRHTYVFVLTMNIDHYRAKTAYDGINAIAKGAYYEITAIPETNPNIESTFEFDIIPVIANQLDYYLYPEAEDKTYVDSTTLKEINRYYIDQFTSLFTVTPDSNNLLKMDTYPKFSNILSYEIAVDPSYSKFVNFKQVVPINGFNLDYNYQAINAENVQVGNTFIMWDVPYQNGYMEDTDGDGIADTWRYTDWLFGEYYLMINFSKDVTQGATIPFTINAYDYERQLIFTYTINIYVEFLPSVKITIDGSNSVVYGLQEYAKLDIEYKNVGDEVILETFGLELFELNNKGEYVQQSNNGSPYTYLIDVTKQYYVRTHSLYGEDNKIGSTSITVSTGKVINGKEHTSTSSVAIQIVYLTVESVTELNAINNIVTMKTGMYLGLQAVVQTNKVDLSKLDFTINGKSAKAYIDDLQNQISGYGRYDANYWQYLEGFNYETLVDYKKYPGFTFSRHYDSEEEQFYRINASQIATPKLRLSFSYYYDVDGTIKLYVAGETPDDVNIYAYDYVFTVNIKDNSTEDTPVPIYTVEEFMNMQEEVNYILQDDLELTYWAPMEFKSAYLDGNGFTITVNSFNLSSLKGSSSDVNAGIFSTIKEGSIVKNLNINISPLLYTDAMLNKAINEEIEPNIDLRETSSIYFGVLAGRNEGTIINVKIVNFDNRKYGNTLYVGTTRGYYQVNGQSTLSSGRIGTMVGMNNGVITNSFVGVNNESSLERTALTNQANKFVSVYTKIVPFSIAGSNNIGGFVALNAGAVSNCYVKNVNITNTTRMSNNSSSGGFVATNSGSVHSAAVTSNNITAFRATDIKLISSAITAGFAYENSGEIQDAYTTIQLDNKNVQTAGFVYNNTEDAIIKNAYTTSKNVASSLSGGNTASHSLFVGEKEKYGKLENCYYLILGNELGEEIAKESTFDMLRALDPAIAIRVTKDDIVSKDMFSGFDFVDDQHSYDGTWYITEDIQGEFPKLQFSENLAYYSRRELSDIITTTFKVENEKSVNLVSAEGGTISNHATTQNTEEVIFAYDNALFSIMGNYVFDVKDSQEIIVSANEDSTYQFTYGENTYRYQIFNDEVDKYVKVLVNPAENGTSEAEYEIQNFTFDYMAFEFIVVKYKNATLSPIYEMYIQNDYSTRKLNTTDTNTFVYEGNTTYTYAYAKNNLGSKFNPIIVTNAKEFAKYITTNTNEYRLNGGKKAFVFGLVENNGNGVNSRYIQIANDIDFSDNNINTRYEVNNTTSVIGVSDIIFNGVLLGNSMALSSIRIVSNVVRENFGIFDSIGVSDDLKREIAENNGVAISSMEDAVLFDLDLNYLEFSNSDANKVGLLGGTITNATISKIDISGVENGDETNEIRGKNLVGALAGLIIGQDNKTKVSEVTVNNVTVVSDKNNLRNLDIDYTPVDTNYKTFSKLDSNLNRISTTYEEIQIEEKFVEGKLSSFKIKNLENVSYAGSVAGAIIVNSGMKMSNGDKSKFIDAYTSYSTLRENKIYADIRDLTVREGINVQADIAGGIVGYIGSPMEKEYTANEGKVIDYAKSATGGAYLDNLYVELSNDFSQTVFGYAYTGGIVGQTKNAYLTKAIVSYPEEVQKTIDANINSIDADKVSSNVFFSRAQQQITSIAIGGIVGQMRDTWIVDSASKVNVVNPLAYIAGGIAGRVDDNAYLAFVYTIGNVKAKNIIGGLIGYYYNNSVTLDKNDSANYYNPFDLHMYNAFGVNIWSQDVMSLIDTNEKSYEYTANFDLYYTESEEVDDKGNKIRTYYIGTVTTEFGPKFDAFSEDEETISADGKTEIIKGEKTILKEEFNIDLDAIKTKGLNTMPELGNQIIVQTHNISGANAKDQDGNAIDVSYGVKIDQTFTGFASNERFTYLGSVIGRYTKPVEENPDTDVTENPETFGQMKFYENIDELYGSAGDNYAIKRALSLKSALTGSATTEEEYYTYYNRNFFNVISSTYGKVEHKGQLDQGNYESKISKNKLNLSYFKSVYDEIPDYVGNTEYNTYDSEIFTQMFGKQAYTSYITGDFVNNNIQDTSTGNKYYRNEFSLYQGFAFNIAEFNYDKLVNAATNNRPLQEELISGLNASTVWYVTAQEYLAKYGYNVNGTFNIVGAEEDLYDAFIEGQTNKLYKLTIYDEEASVGADGKKPYRNVIYTGEKDADGNDIVDEVESKKASSVFDLSDYANDDDWYRPTRITVNNNSYFTDAETPITIKFKITHADSSDTNNGYKVYGLFDTIVGCTFSNINFEIDITDINTEMYTINQENHMGLFANVVSGCTFLNCKFTFVDNNANSVVDVTTTTGERILTIGNGINSTGYYAVKDFGMLFGLSMNSSIRNTSFSFEKYMQINYNNINNVTDLISAGFLIGQMNQTTLQNITINENKNDFVFNYNVEVGCVESVNHNFGGIIGLASTSRIENLVSNAETKYNITGLQTDIQNVHNLGALIGLVDSSLTLKDVCYYGNFAINKDVISGRDYNYNKSTINAGIIAQLKSTSVLNLQALENVGQDNSIDINTTNKFLNVGVIGNSTGSGNSIDGIINELTINIKNDFEEIKTINRVPTQIHTLTANIGGIVGKEDNASAYANCINSKDINVKVGNLGVESLNVGGFIGSSQGGSVDKSYNVGDIYVNSKMIAGVKNQHNGSVNIGGLVGLNEKKAFSMNTAISYGDIYYHDVDNTKYYMAGLIGYTVKKLDLENVLSFTNFIRLDNEDTNYFAPVGTSKQTESRINAMANAFDITSVWTDSYYVAEHDPVHSQDADNKNQALLTTSYKNYIDMICNNVSVDTAFFESTVIAWNTVKTGSKLPYILEMETKYITERVEDGSKYQPRTSENYITQDLINKYKYIILDSSQADVEITGDLDYDEKLLGTLDEIFNLEIPTGVVISGDNTEGTTRYYVETDYKTPFINSNKGVISNILFVVHDLNQTFQTQKIEVDANNDNYTLFMDTNFGHIMNIGVSHYDKNGITLNVDNKIPAGSTAGETIVSIIRENNGGIYTSGTQFTYRSSSSKIEAPVGISYFVGINNAVIKNSYSTSTLTATTTKTDKEFITFGAMAVKNAGLIGASVFGGTFIVENPSKNEDFVKTANSNFVGVNKIVVKVDGVEKTINGIVNNDCFSDKSQMSGANKSYSEICLIGAERSGSGETITLGTFKNNSIYWNRNSSKSEDIVNSCYPYIYNGIKIITNFSATKEIYIYTSRQLDIAWKYYSKNGNANSSKIIIDIDTTNVGETTTISNVMKLNVGEIKGSIIATSNNPIIFEQGFLMTNGENSTNKGTINLTLEHVIMKTGDDPNTGNFVNVNNTDSTIEITSKGLSVEEPSAKGVAKYLVKTNYGEFTVNSMTSVNFGITEWEDNELRIHTNTGKFILNGDSDGYTYIVTDSNTGTITGTSDGTDDYIKNGGLKLKSNAGTIHAIAFNKASLLITGTVSDTSQNNTGTIESIRIENGNMYLGNNNGIVQNIIIKDNSNLPNGFIGINNGTLDEYIAVENSTLGQPFIKTNKGKIEANVSFNNVSAADVKSLFVEVHDGNAITNGSISIANSKITSGENIENVGLAFGDVKKDVKIPITISSGSITQKKVYKVGLAIGNAYGRIELSEINVGGTINITDGAIRVGGAIGYVDTTVVLKSAIKVNDLTMSVGGGTSVNYIGGAIGDVCNSSIEGAITVSNANITIKTTDSSNYIGGVIGCASSDTAIEDDLTAKSTNITLNSGANALYVGGVVGIVNTDNISDDSSWSYESGTIKCDGLKNSNSVKMPTKWDQDTPLTTDSIKDYNKGISAYSIWGHISGQYNWRKFGAVQGFNMHLGLINGGGTTPSNVESKGKLSNMSSVKLTAVEMQVSNFAEEDATYGETENDWYFAIEFYCYNVVLADYTSSNSDKCKQYYCLNTPDNIVKLNTYSWDGWGEGVTVVERNVSAARTELLNLVYNFRVDGSVDKMNIPKCVSGLYDDLYYYNGGDKWIVWKGGSGDDSAWSVFNKNHDGSQGIWFDVKNKIFFAHAGHKEKNAIYK